MSPSEKQSAANAIRVVLENSVGGDEFTSMSQEELVTKLGMSRSLAKYFYERYLFWIHIRMDCPPEGAQVKRAEMVVEVPGGGET